MMAFNGVRRYVSWTSNRFVIMMQGVFVVITVAHQE